MAAKKYSHRVSYVLSLPGAPGGHRLGINGLAVDLDRSSLYSAGRDGTICTWNLQRPDGQQVREKAVRDTSDGRVEQATSDGDGDGDVDGDDDQDPFSDIHRVTSRTTTTTTTTTTTAERPAPASPPLPASQPRPPPEKASPPTQSSTLRHQFQAHTHWINDIQLVDGKRHLVSASSDTSVRIWSTTRAPPTSPSSIDAAISPKTIGQHGDYVKCLASPDPAASWIASGGLDRKIYLWDLHGAGEVAKLECAADDDVGAKGSVYALAARPQVIASGGPESVVRVWDPRSGKGVTRLIGHTNNIRDVLISQTGDTIVSASSDQTVKIWSLTAGRCLSTLTMHSDSVWSLYSDHPQLSVFYSADRSGLAMKTDLRRAESVSQGLCVALLQEHEGIQRIIADGGYIWTATNRSSIHRWDDVDTTMPIESPVSSPSTGTADEGRSSQQLSPIQGPVSDDGAPPEEGEHARADKDKRGTDTQKQNEQAEPSQKQKKPLIKIPRSAIAPLTITSTFPDDPAAAALADDEEEAESSVPIQLMPNETIEGQYGLTKHSILNDRRHALTQDTAGEILMWDLLKCAPVRAFGKRHLDDVLHEINTDDAMAPWCTLDTRTGHLTVSLDANRCFDAEVYADEAGLDDCAGLKEDQRLNYGKWLLRNLFRGLIDTEIERDEQYRQTLPIAAEPAGAGAGAGGAEPPSSLLPASATPGAHQKTPLESPSMHLANANVPADYFSPSTNNLTPTPQAHASTTGTAPSEHSATSDSNAPEKEREEAVKTKRSGSIFGKNLKLSLTSKKGRQQSVAAAAEAAAKATIEEKAGEDDQQEKAEDRGPEYEDSLKGVIEKIRAEYDAALAEKPAQVPASRIVPSTTKETPALSIPNTTAVMIREEVSDAVVASDLYRGNVGCMVNDADRLEQVIPTWLGELLLRNIQPSKEVQKLTFVLIPWENQLPPLNKPDPIKKTVESARLNANRMLRAKKILAYVAERIDPVDPKNPDANPYKPEEYLELYCQNMPIPPNMTLYAIRTQIWRSGSDILLHYKANGKRAIPAAAARPASGSGGGGESAGSGAGDGAMGGSTANSASASASLSAASAEAR